MGRSIKRDNWGGPPRGGLEYLKSRFSWGVQKPLRKASEKERGGRKSREEREGCSFIGRRLSLRLISTPIFERGRSVSPAEGERKGKWTEGTAEKKGGGNSLTSLREKEGSPSINEKRQHHLRLRKMEAS